MKSLLLVALLLMSSASFALDEIISQRTNLAFQPTLAKLQRIILDQQYSVSLVQRCDYGLKDAGYNTDKYRIVFFGTHKDIKQISDSHPELSPFLPLRIAVIAENDETILSVMNPGVFLETVSDKKLVKIVKSWIKDIAVILKYMKNDELNPFD